MGEDNENYDLEDNQSLRGISPSNPVDWPPESFDENQEQKAIERAPTIDSEYKDINLADSTSVSNYHVLQSPMPSAKQMSEYEEIVPGYVERWLAMREKQALHCMSMEEKQQKHIHKIEQANTYGILISRILGQIYGLGIGLSAIGCTVYFARIGQAWTAADFGSTGIAGLVSVFVIENRKPK